MNPLTSPSASSASRSRGFTLIELLVVIAIIGILAAIIIPTVGSVRTSANKAKTKTQFSQWASAMELFKQEYGFYPDVSDSNGKLDTTKFLANLTGRNYAGTKLTGTDLDKNKKGISFYSVGGSELTAGSNGSFDTDSEIVDAFGNSDIAVFVDRNRDGVIGGSGTGAETFTATRLNVLSGSDQTPAKADPDGDNFPDTGIRAGVAFYSAGKGASANDYVFSWK